MEYSLKFQIGKMKLLIVLGDPETVNIGSIPDITTRVFGGIRNAI